MVDFQLGSGLFSFATLRPAQFHDLKRSDDLRLGVTRDDKVAYELRERFSEMLHIPKRRLTGSYPNVPTSRRKDLTPRSDSTKGKPNR